MRLAVPSSAATGERDGQKSDSEKTPTHDHYLIQATEAAIEGSKMMIFAGRTHRSMRLAVRLPLAKDRSLGGGANLELEFELMPANVPGMG